MVAKVLKAEKSPVKEVLKFVARMVVLGLPFLVSYLTDKGNVELAAVFSAVLVLVDKAVHESDVKLKGLLPF